MCVWQAPVGVAVPWVSWKATSLCRNTIGRSPVRLCEEPGRRRQLAPDRHEVVVWVLAGGQAPGAGAVAGPLGVFAPPVAAAVAEGVGASAASVPLLAAPAVLAAAELDPVLGEGAGVEVVWIVAAGGLPHGEARGGIGGAGEGGRSAGTAAAQRGLHGAGAGLVREVAAV